MRLTDSIYIGSTLSDKATFLKLNMEHQKFLKRDNGLIVFNGGLHIRGCVLSPNWHSLHYYWLGEGALYKTYNQLTEEDIPFAQDCLGDQFILRNNIVYILSGETGELENLEVSLTEFLINANNDPMEYLSLHPLKQFFNEGGKLGIGELLNVYPLFSTKESANGVSLKNVPMMEQLNFLKSFYSQTKELNEDNRIKISIKN